MNHLVLVKLWVEMASTLSHLGNYEGAVGNRTLERKLSHIGSDQMRNNIRLSTEKRILLQCALCSEILVQSGHSRPFGALQKSNVLELNTAPLIFAQVVTSVPVQPQWKVASNFKDPCSHCMFLIRDLVDCRGMQKNIEETCQNRENILEHSRLVKACENLIKKDANS